MKLKSLMAVLGLGGAFIFLNTYCTKISATDIGTDLLPAVDNVYTFDTTLDVVTNNFISPDSSIPYFNASGDAAAIGSVNNDPQFGKISSSLFFELKPSYYPYFFENAKDSLYLDSAVLSLAYDHSWGDSNMAQQWNVYQLTEKIRSDTTYRVNSPFTFTTLLGNATLTPSALDDSVILQNERLKAQLRIKLDDNFGRLLLDQDSTDAYKSDSLFRDFFNGFAIVPTTGGSANALSYFSLTDSRTALTIYYRFDKNGKRDTTSRIFKFVLGTCGQALYIQRDLSGSQLNDHLAVLPAGDSLVYIQAAPGSFAEIKASSIDGFRAAKGNVIIHRAELSMQQVFSPGENDEYLKAPAYLYLDAFDTSAFAFKPFVPDLQFSTSGTPLLNNFGGIAKYSTDPQGNSIATYTFVISRYLQGIVTRNELQYKMRLFAPNQVYYSDSPVPPFTLNNMAEGRVKLGGGNHSAYKMKIHIIYSKI